MYKWLFQLDDSKSLHRKWLFNQTSMFEWLFGVPGMHVIQNSGEPQRIIGCLPLLKWLSLSSFDIIWGHPWLFGVSRLYPILCITGHLKTTLHTYITA